MLRSIQWKLVIISFLLVWLAMSIIGVFVTNEIQKNLIESLTATIKARAYFLADMLKDEMSGARNIQDTVNNWFIGQGGQIDRVKVLKNAQVLLAEAGTSSIKGESLVEYMIDQIIKQKKEIVIMNNEVGNEYSKSIAVPIYSSNSDFVGIIYINADLSEIEGNMKKINSMLTYATIWALAITVILGSLLAKTITDPIKEVISKAEKLAKGEFEQVVAVKSNDEVGQLTGMFNYLSDRLKTTLDETGNEKNKLDTILTNMTDGIIAVSRAGEILHTNPAIYNIFSICKEDLENKNFDYISEKMNWGINHEALFTDLEKANNILVMNDRIIKTNVVFFGNEKNETVGAIIVFQDVTEQERLDRMRKEF